jgi:hypothetical protein
MLEVAAFFAGFTTGWAVRATANSSRSLVVGLIAHVHGAADRVRTLTAIEREALEDLLAEGKAVYEAGRRRKRPATDAARASVAGATGHEVNGHAGPHEVVNGHAAHREVNGHAGSHEVHGAGPASEPAASRPATNGRTARKAGSLS